jgi:hypothetical protein
MPLAQNSLSSALKTAIIAQPSPLTVLSKLYRTSNTVSSKKQPPSFPRLSLYLLPLPLPRPADPRGADPFGHASFICPFCPHRKHSMLLISRPPLSPDLRPPDPESDVRPPRFASSLTVRRGGGGRGDPSPPRLCRAPLRRASRFFEAISRFVSRISSAAGSSES